MQRTLLFLGIPPTDGSAGHGQQIHPKSQKSTRFIVPIML
jgi:hypothetical protein